jgi:hypothetical protein
MKPTSVFKLSLTVMCLLIAGASFLTPESASKEAIAKRGSGELIIECNGKKYSAEELEGTATIGADKKAYLFFSGEHKIGNKYIRIQFNCNPLPAFKAGKYELTSVQNHMDKHLKDGAILLVYTTDAANSEEAPPQDPTDISGDSETGTFIITNITTNVSNNTATLSGSYEFTGKNGIDYSTVKTISVKGTFKDLEVTYANLSGRR